MGVGLIRMRNVASDFSTVLKAIKDGDIKARAVKKIKKTYWYISQKELDRLKKELGTD